MASVSSILPPAEGGWLSYWLLVMALVTAFHSLVNVAASPPRPARTTEALYSGARVVTPLQCRTLGAWTTISSMVRVVAAYHPTDAATYSLALFTFLVADVHWWTEYAVFGTTTRAGAMASLAVDVPTAAIMAVGWVRGWYF